MNTDKHGLLAANDRIFSKSLSIRYNVDGYGTIVDMDEAADHLLPQEETSEIMQRYRSAMDAGLYTDADEIAQQFLGKADEWYAQRQKNPTPYERLADEADFLLENFEYAAHEETLLKIIALPDLPVSQLSRAHVRISHLYCLLNREAEALEHARLATTAIREYKVTAVLLVMQLHNEIGCLLHFGHANAAVPLVCEARKLIENEPLWNILLAANLILRAECAVRTCKPDDIESDLETAFQLLQPMAEMQFAAGVRDRLAHYWKVIAMEQTASKNLAGALEAREKVLSLRQEIAQTSHCTGIFAIEAMADAFHELAGTLRLLGRFGEAEVAESECRDTWAFLRLAGKAV